MELALIVATGVGVTETVAADDAVQPFAAVTKTEYEVVVVGETVIGLLVPPGVHKYVPLPIPVSVVFCPLHNVVLPEIAAMGDGFTVTNVVAVSEQDPLETFTV